MAELERIEPIEEYVEPEPTPLDIAKAKGQQRIATKQKVDGLEQANQSLLAENVVLKERLAKIESANTVMTELAAKEAEPIIKEPIISK